MTDEMNDTADLLAEVDRLREQVETLQAERAKAARQLMRLVSKYTIAHPENTLRVIKLLHEDAYAIAKALAEEGPTP